MSDLIDRDSALKAIEEIRCFFDKSLEPYQSREETIEVIKNLPTVDRPQGFVRCKDCKWWDRYGDGRMGYCHAIKHNYYTTNWEIHILRTYRDDFYCADAEVREEEEDE